jgi:hypothetical protein
VELPVTRLRIHKSTGGLLAALHAAASKTAVRKAPCSSYRPRQRGPWNIA